MEEIDLTQKWEKNSKRKSPVHRFFDFAESSVIGFRKLFGWSIPEAVFTFKNDEGVNFWKKVDYDEMIRVYGDKLKDPDFIKWVQPRLYSDSEIAIVWIKKNCSAEKITGASDISGKARTADNETASQDCRRARTGQELCRRGLLKYI